MSKIIIGRYLPGSTFVYRVDPRAKLLTTFYFIIMIFFATNWQGYLAITIFGLAAVVATGLKAKVFWDGVKPMIWLILFTALMQTFFMAGGTTYWHWWIFTLSSEGIINGIYVFLRFSLIILVSTVMTVTTKPLEIADAMEWILKPLKLFKVNVSMISLVISIALRFVPTLFDQTVKIMNAQRSRGADFNDGGLIKRAKSVVPMLVPLFIDSLEVALDLSTAMESRGYKGSEGRTRYRILTWSKVDLVPLFYCIILTILMVTTRML